MLLLLALLLLLGIVLALLLTAWSMWFQTYLYTEAAQGLIWRGPAAAGVILFVVLVWVIFDYRAPGRFRPFWESVSTETSKPFAELRIPDGKGKEDTYRARPGKRNEYRLGGLLSGKALPSTPDEIIVVEGENRAVFKPERDENGQYKRRKSGIGEEPLRYYDEKGRLMVEGSLGQLASFRGGLFFVNALLNLLLLVACFLACWLLLLFQWPHALGHALALCLLLMLFVLPPLLTYAEGVAQARAVPRA